MNIVTGYRGEAHITSDQDRAANQGAIGTGSYIMNVGQQMITETISATEIRIRDGALCHQGCIGVIAAGAYDVVEIANGSQGMLRKDLIVCRYTKDAETNVENLELVAIQGEPAASSPSVPSYNSGNIQAGDTPVDMPLYQVNINGISIDSITKVATNVRTQAEADTLLSALNSKLSPMYVIDTVQCLGDGTVGKHTYAVPSVSGYTPVGIVGYAASGGYEGSRGVYQLNLVGTEINIGWENAVASNRGLNVNVLYLHT